MSEISARIVDLINFSSNQKPLEFESSFKEILQNKVADAIDNKKSEIASIMFNAPEENNEEELETDSEEETEEQEDD
jgi:hypothetical protein